MYKICKLNKVVLCRFAVLKTILVSIDQIIIFKVATSCLQTIFSNSLDKVLKSDIGL